MEMFDFGSNAIISRLVAATCLIFSKSETDDLCCEDTYYTLGPSELAGGILRDWSPPLPKHTSKAPALQKAKDSFYRCQNSQDGVRKAYLENNIFWFVQCFKMGGDPALLRFRMKYENVITLYLYIFY